MNNTSRWKQLVCLVSCGFLLLMSSAAMSNNLSNGLFFPCGIRPVVTIAGGSATTSHLGQSTIFTPIDDSTYTYSRHSASQTRGLFGTFLGVEFSPKPCWAMQIGLAYYQPTFDVRGILSQGPDAISTDQYTYKYEIMSRQLLLESKVLATWQCRFHPYVLAGIGESFNRTRNYQTSVPPFLTFTPDFNSHTSHSFSYSVGLGIDMDVNPSLRAGLGYRFASLGRADMGQGTIEATSIPNTLKQSTLYANEVVAQLTFLLA